jgi:hypothetical protein
MSVVATTTTETAIAAVPEQAKTKATDWGTLPIEQLSAVHDADGSKLADPAKAKTALHAAFTEVASWIEHDRLARGATARYCELSMQMRTLCLTKNNAIDWAGNTETYKTLWNNRTKAMWTEAGLSETEQNRFQAAVRGYNRDNDYTRRFMAQYLLDNDAGGTLARGSTRSEDGKTITLGSALTKAMQKAAGTQVNRKGDKALPGFEPATFAEQATTVGLPKAKQDSGSPSGSGAEASTEPSALWEQLRAEIRKTNGKSGEALRLKLSPAKTASEIHWQLTAAFDSLFGEPDKPGLATIADSDGLAERYKTIAALANQIAAGLKDRGAVRKDRAKRYVQAQ